ncbi:hypothetical protein VB005_01341 [Metarhizium brunneum]
MTIIVIVTVTVTITTELSAMSCLQWIIHTLRQAVVMKPSLLDYLRCVIYLDNNILVSRERNNV